MQIAGSAESDPYLDLDDESYDSAGDEDFQLGAAEQDDTDVASSDEDVEADITQEPPQKRRKLSSNRTTRRDRDEGTELDSGDEKTIRKAKERHEKSNADYEAEEDSVDLDEDEECSAGGFVKTRAMRTKM
jgi:hypothetical protein